MSIGTILVIAALVVFVAAYLSRPFWAPETIGHLTFSVEKSSLLAEKERILTALEELDFDYKLGKVLDEVYELHRKELLLKGSEVLKDLEARGEVSQTLLNELKTVEPDNEKSLDPVEAMIAARKLGKKAQGVKQFCSKCGANLQKGDAFCPVCGTKAGK